MTVEEIKKILNSSNYDNLPELPELYKSLYEIVDSKNGSNKTSKKGPLTICPAIKGSDYKEEVGGLMFVGRAINSWCPLDASMKSEEKSIQKRIERCEGCTLDWVEGKNSWEHCKKNDCPFAKGPEKVDGRGVRSPFWQMVEYICRKDLYNLGDDWYKRIVWSNLYKASYTYGGNPTGFYEKQIVLCNAILIKEIEKYNPSEIYFITEKKGISGKDKRTWFCDKYKGDICFKAVYDFLKNSEWKDKIVVLTRPEFQNKDEIWKNREDLNGNKIEK